MIAKWKQISQRANTKCLFKNPLVLSLRNGTLGFQQIFNRDIWGMSQMLHEDFGRQCPLPESSSPPNFRNTGSYLSYKSEQEWPTSYTKKGLFFSGPVKEARLKILAGNGNLNSSRTVKESDARENPSAEHLPCSFSSQSHLALASQVSCFAGALQPGPGACPQCQFPIVQ